MASDVTMPRLSDSMEEGTILKWLVDEGGEVKRGEPLVEIETDKANMTYDADADGVLIEVVAGEGDTLPIGDVIARIGEEGEAPSGGGGEGKEPGAARGNGGGEGRGGGGKGGRRGGGAKGRSSGSRRATTAAKRRRRRSRRRTGRRRRRRRPRRSSASPPLPPRRSRAAAAKRTATAGSRPLPWPAAWRA